MKGRKAFSKCLSKIVRPFHSRINIRGSAWTRTILLAAIEDPKVAVMHFYKLMHFLIFVKILNGEEDVEMEAIFVN